MFLLASAVASLSLTVTFQLSHCLEEAITLAPEDTRRRAPSGTSTRSRRPPTSLQKNTVIRWYVGGLNHQIEHHLFPRVPHTLHPQLAGIVPP